MISPLVAYNDQALGAKGKWCTPPNGPRVESARTRVLGSFSKSDKEFLCTDARLLEYSAKRANFDFAMVRHYTTRRTTPKNDMATALTKYNKTETLKSADRLRT